MGKSAIIKNYEYTEYSFPAEEYDIFSRMVAQDVKMANLLQPLTYYRIHKQNISLKKVRSSVLKTMSLRYELFKVSSKRLKIWFRIYHWFFYRKSLQSGALILRIFYLLISTILSPGKIMKRL